MNTNIGGLDRPLRIIAGLLILSLFFFIEGDGRWWALVGLVPLVTGIIGWCPAYTLLGIRTCKMKSR